MAKPLVFLEFWLGVKKFAKFGLFIAFFLTKFLPKSLNFSKISKILLLNLDFCAPWQKVARIQAFFDPPSDFLQILAFYCIFVHQFLAKTLNFLKKHALFGKKFEEFALKVMKIKRFSKILLVNLGFGRSVTKSCWNSSFFCPPCEKSGFYSIFEHQFLGILVKNCNFFFSSKNLGKSAG